MKKSVLKAYAKLIVKMGANVQKNQDVIISASVDDAYFVKYVVIHHLMDILNPLIFSV